MHSGMPSSFNMFLLSMQKLALNRLNSACRVHLIFPQFQHIYAIDVIFNVERVKFNIVFKFIIRIASKTRY